MFDEMKGLAVSRFASTNRRARLIQRTLGTRVAAGYLRNQGRSIQGAVAVLAIKRGMQA